MRVVGDIARLGARRYGERVAVTVGDTQMTYGQLNAEANRLAHGLGACGVKSGDRVMLIATNCLEYPIIASAVAKCGAVLVPLNFRYRPRELAYLVNDAGPKILAFSQPLGEVVLQAEAEFLSRPLLVAISGVPPSGVVPLAQLMDGSSTAEPVAHVDASATAMLMYTSGTTGVPKGVLFPHTAYMATYQALIVEGDLAPTDVTLVNLPLFHQAGLNALLLPTLMVGGSVVLTTGSFDPEQVIDSVSRYRVTTTMWVPTMLAALVSVPGVERHDLSSLEKIWYGSAPISPDVLQASLNVFKADFYQWYGQTESGMVSVLRPEDHKTRSQCTGREVYNAEIRIVDESGWDTGAGGVGEVICATGLHGMSGYLNNPEATAETIRNGWLYTGDLARVEGDGFFTIVDRRRDMIISGGENIYPKEIENVLSAHPGVREVAVIGIPDDRYGESVCAIVVRSPGAMLEGRELIDFCATKVAGFKKPKRVEFVQELPKNAMGKVTKNVLREPYWEGRDKKI